MYEYQHFQEHMQRRRYEYISPAQDDPEVHAVDMVPRAEIYGGVHNYEYHIAQIEKGLSNN